MRIQILSPCLKCFLYLACCLFIFGYLLLILNCLLADASAIVFFVLQLRLQIVDLRIQTLFLNFIVLNDLRITFLCCLKLVKHHQEVLAVCRVTDYSCTFTFREHGLFRRRFNNRRRFETNFNRGVI